MQPSSFKQNHEFYMKKALLQAHCAFRRDEVPVGAVVVNQQGEIIARAYNCVEKSNTQTGHAELRAIAQAGKRLGDWRLEECWLYVTLEPCAMCMNAIIMARLAGLVYGAESPLYGYQRLESQGGGLLYKKNTLAIIGGIYKDHAINLLQRFFKDKRKKSE